MERFIGCMVSLDCGETLGVYQGQVESINPVQGAITLVRSFRNGVPYKLPHVTLRSQDIINLEIIKTSDEVKLAEGSGQLPNVFPERSQNGRTHNTTTSPQPKIAPIKQLVVFGQNKNESRVPAFPENGFNSRTNPTNTYQSDYSTAKLGGTPHQSRQKGFSVTPPNSHGKNQFENGHFQRIFESPNEEDASKYKNCNKVMSSPQTPIYKSNRWNGDQKYKDAAKVPFVRPSNSFTDHFYHQPQRGYENQFSPLHKPSRPAKRNNSECFDRCDGDFDIEFDFEKNLALFDKAAVAEEVKGSHNNNHGGNGRQRNGYPSHQEKYKCDENIIKGVEYVKRQISLVDNHSKREESQLGEYSTDSGLIVPGVPQSHRDKLLSLAEKMEFGRDKVVEAFGRCISDVILQYLGGSTRFEAKNFHQRPKVVILCGSNQWQSAAAVACGRLLANRSAHVVVYHQPPRSNTQKEDSTFASEMKFYRMTGGTLVTDVKDLPVPDNIDLVLSTLDCQPTTTAISDAARWAASKKAPVFSIEPSFAGPPLLEYKRSFVCGIPGWYDSSGVGQVCFCDVGLPEDIYKAAGINFKSPFFDKFFLTLHKVD